MQQVFILGASSAYGVGSSEAGWGDLIKQYLHERMYVPGGEGEKYEVYNFGKSGATIEFVQNFFPKQLEMYSRGQKVVAVVCVGANNASARDEPTHYTSTPEEFTEQLEKLLSVLKEKCDGIIWFGNTFVDETKTNPKPNPLTGGKSYTTNERRQLFNQLTKEKCQEQSIPFVELSLSQEEWLEHYLYEDGLHPNQAGHQLIFEAMKSKLEELL